MLAFSRAEEIAFSEFPEVSNGEVATSKYLNELFPLTEPGLVARREWRDRLSYKMLCRFRSESPESPDSLLATYVKILTESIEQTVKEIEAQHHF